MYQLFTSWNQRIRQFQSDDYNEVINKASEFKSYRIELNGVTVFELFTPTFLQEQSA